MGLRLLSGLRLSSGLMAPSGLKARGAIWPNSTPGGLACFGGCGLIEALEEDFVEDALFEPELLDAPARSPACSRAML